MLLYRRERSPPLTPEERDARTVFCMQLAARIRSRDLVEFFTSIGKVSTILPFITTTEFIIVQRKYTRTSVANLVNWVVSCVTGIAFKWIGLT